MLHFSLEGGVKMLAFGYLRREPTMDAPSNAAWLEAQRLAVRRFCRKKRIDLVRFFEDDRGEYSENSALDEMLGALEQKEADCAVVCGEYEGASSYNIDHLERNVEIRFFSHSSPYPLFEEAV